jgi:hypothetical protein
VWNNQANRASGERLSALPVTAAATRVTASMQAPAEFFYDLPQAFDVLFDDPAGLR